MLNSLASDSEYIESIVLEPYPGARQRQKGLYYFNELGYDKQVREHIANSLANMTVYVVPPSEFVDVSTSILRSPFP
jgi:hypothetical protein